MSREMLEIGVAMDYYGGLSHWAAHGQQMVGAAMIAQSWAEVILVEAKSADLVDEGRPA